jgi:GT2 family glycosyltransferase
MLPYVGVLHRFGWTLRNFFHTEYYLAGNPDLALTRMPPVLHFLLFGAFEGRKPSPLFDPDFYLHANADVARAEVNPLLHYLKWGAAEGRKPHPLCDGSLAQLMRALEEPPESVLYSWWMRQECRVAVPKLTTRPHFSLLLAVLNPQREWLEDTIASVRAQSYPHWEFCICNSPKNEPWVKDCLEAASLDNRVQLMQTSPDAWASVALNVAAERSTGDYLVLLEDSDRLQRDALHWLAATAPCDLIYSDEDQLDKAGNRTQPLFKPDWSPELLLSGMYIGGIMAIARAAWQSVGGLRPEHEGAREYDLALRLAEGPHSRIKHVPRVLYSRRSVGLPSSRDPKALGECLAEAVQRRGVAGTVEDGPREGSFRVLRAPRGTPLTSIILCSRSPQLLDRCLVSLASRTLYPHREVIVVQHLAGKPKELEAVIARHRAARLTHAGPFHFSRMNNMAAEAAKGSILVFLNDDTEIIEGSWLDRLVAQVERPDVGVAGARLLYPSGTLQHGGVVIGVGDGCAHVGRNTSEMVSHWPWLDLTRDVSAVTGACLAIRKSVFCQIGGFGEQFPVNYNDIDLCLRVREAGYRVIYEAGAVLRHYECQSRVGFVTAEERRDWYARWAQAMEAGDPFYNINLTRKHEDLSLRSRTERVGDC